MRVLVDSSVWIRHFKSANPDLQALLATNDVLLHPHVITELALGSLRDRQSFLRTLERMPQALVATYSEVMAFIHNHQLFNIGIGFVDVHMLASTLLMPGRQLWTADTRLHAAATRLGIAYP